LQPNIRRVPSAARRSLVLDDLLQGGIEPLDRRINRLFLCGRSLLQCSCCLFAFFRPKKDNRGKMGRYPSVFDNCRRRMSNGTTKEPVAANERTDLANLADSVACGLGAR
jgi:hypothetical protein